MDSISRARKSLQEQDRAALACAAQFERRIELDQGEAVGTGERAAVRARP